MNIRSTAQTFRVPPNGRTAALMAEPLLRTRLTAVTRSIVEWEDTAKGRITHIQGTDLSVITLFAVWCLNAANAGFAFIYSTIQAVVADGWCPR